MKKGKLSKRFKSSVGVGILISFTSLFSGPSTPQRPSPNNDNQNSIRQTFNLLGSTAKLLPNDETETHFTLQGRWEIVDNRFTEQMKIEENRAAFDKWVSQFDYLKGASLTLQLQVIDREVDKLIDYTREPQCAPHDNWQTPIETLKLEKGDCEDYAILKYHTLRKLGVPESKLMLLVVANDPTKDRLNHALLGVRVNGTETVLLDNNSSASGMGQLINTTDSNYKLFYVISQDRTWKVDWPEPKPKENNTPDPCGGR